MKKIILIFCILTFSLALYADGRTSFVVKKNCYYEFSIFFKENTQYKFLLVGEPLFWFQIIEPSGNPLRQHVSMLGTLEHREDFLDPGVYKILIYSVNENFITMTWEEY